MKIRIDEKSRIKLKPGGMFYDARFCVQIKQWWGWKTISTLQPSKYRPKGYEYLIKEAKYQIERYNRPTELEIGRSIMQEFEGDKTYDGLEKYFLIKDSTK